VDPTDETLVDSSVLHALQDRADIADALYRYSSSVDSFDNGGVRGDQLPVTDPVEDAIRARVSRFS
jgi:hypothetical protein